MSEAISQPDGNNRRRKLTIAAAVFGAIGLGYGGWYLLFGQYAESTDDAYVNANMVYVNTQVTGTVTALGADDNQPVRAGQPLVTLDGADAQTAQALSAAQLGETVRQVRGAYVAVAAAEATVAQRQSDLTRAQGDLSRRQALPVGESVSQEELAHARDAVQSDQNALLVAERQLDQARAAVAGAVLRQHPSVMRARAAYIQATLNVLRNQIPAPVDGYVARRSVQVGQRVAPGSALMAVVPLQAAWIDANFKEPQLHNIRVGQPVSVNVDLYGGRVTYHGTVASMSAGSGGAFSLLPAQNATGNWIKVVQRVPVRVALDPRELAAHPLRVGLSAEVEVDTHHRDGRVDAALPLPNVVLSTPVFAAQLATAEHQADAIVAREAGSAP
ncbi:MAG: efflux RND transporter periplasmic adaptor subunit [Paludibacterium sp.]|uniref:HlyD family secretion protein n=1 Tax=Paludibacterium sp. TaxID=1917523 RepID=UPI0025EF2755|nr:efflux RND transporter periplasmic adaptor subunit [Paludibacterium sp.]MBV8049488.1 efflux RND transporter periplasmic adaptor subunit [Paludibacterium sp.]MBV8646252.1 efflux RND transporter periplasmic adaptor subunit [Paludibacterium sp.]